MLNFLNQWIWNFEPFQHNKCFFKWLLISKWCYIGIFSGCLFDKGLFNGIVDPGKKLVEEETLWLMHLSKNLSMFVSQTLQICIIFHLKKKLGQVRLTETKEAGQSIFLANSSDTNARWVKGKEKKYVWKRYIQRQRKRTRKRKQRRRQMTRRLILATCRWRAVPRRSSAWTNAE